MTQKLGFGEVRHIGIVLNKEYQQLVSLQGLSFGRKLVRLTHLVPEDRRPKLHFINGRN